MSINEVRARWAGIRDVAATVAVLADAVAEDLGGACTRRGELLVPAGCEQRLLAFGEALDRLTDSYYRPAPPRPLTP